MEKAKFKNTNVFFKDQKIEKSNYQLNELSKQSYKEKYINNKNIKKVKMINSHWKCTKVGKLKWAGKKRFVDQW